MQLPHHACPNLMKGDKGKKITFFTAHCKVKALQHTLRRAFLCGSCPIQVYIFTLDTTYMVHHTSKVLLQLATLPLWFYKLF